MRYRCRRRRRCQPPKKKRGRIVRVSQARVLDTCTDTRTAAASSYSPPCCRHPAHRHRRSEHGSCGRSIYVCLSWSGLPISGQISERKGLCAEMEVSGFGIESLNYYNCTDQRPSKPTNTWECTVLLCTAVGAEGMEHGAQRLAVRSVRCRGGSK